MVILDEASQPNDALKGPIFILGAHKSGTTLLRSLFDGHPNLFVIPKETHVFERSGYWVDYYLRRTQPRDLHLEEVIKGFTEQLNKFNVATNYQADSVTLNRWDIQIFQNSLKNVDLSNPRGFFTAVFEAMHQSLHGQPLGEHQRIVEKSVEHAEFAIDLQAIFPEAHFIHIIRNPYSNFVSLRKYKSTHGYPFLKGLIYSLYNSYYHMWRNVRLIRNYHIIRYEDLVSDPKAQMQHLAKSVNIPFHSNLLHPTQEGEKWVGNSVYSAPFSGVSVASLDRWKNEIYSLEINLINKAIPVEIFNTYGYELLKSKKTKIQLIGGENFKTFIANRLLQYYL